MQQPILLVGRLSGSLRVKLVGPRALLPQPVPLLLVELLLPQPLLQKRA